MQHASMHVSRKSAALRLQVPLGAARCRQVARRLGSNMRCHASDPSEYRRLMFLPDGAWFMSTEASDAPVYGESFVMHAPRHQLGQQQQVQGLVLQRPQPRGVAVRQPEPSSEIVPLHLDDIEVSIVVLPVEEKSLGIVPFKQMLQDVDVAIMPYEQQEQLPDVSASSSSSLAIVPRDSSMLGMVMGSALRKREDDVQLPVDNNTVYETFNTKHKRRTMKIKFTCQRCGATTIKPVNPHAWANGTVFAKCGRCNITHKLIDNLKLFHELSGPVFPSPIQPMNNSSSTSNDGDSSGFEYDSNGFPVLPERLRLKPWQAPDSFPDDISNLN